VKDLKERVIRGAGEVAFSALSRLQDYPTRLKSYFLKRLCARLDYHPANYRDLRCFCERRHCSCPWTKVDAGCCAVSNSGSYNPDVCGRQPLELVAARARSGGPELENVLVFAPVMIVGYVLALPYGPKGVAFAYSAVMLLWAVPAI